MTKQEVKEVSFSARQAQGLAGVCEGVVRAVDATPASSAWRSRHSESRLSIHARLACRSVACGDPFARAITERSTEASSS